jgi:hypothetical protein
MEQIEIWDRFCRRQKVMETWVPLFSCSPSGAIATRVIGTKNPRKILRRSEAMETMLREQCALLLEDWTSGSHELDGLIYMIAVEEEGQAIPLYIGKAESFGKGDRNLSANIADALRETSKFARWGDNYAYHIGDLSAVTLFGHHERYQTKKYASWASTLFESYPSDEPRLVKSVYFWTKAWSRHETGIWEEFGPTRLTFLEYLLIGVASTAFGDRLLNREGRNRNFGNGYPEAESS